ncbi:MAG: hypothetical protein ACRC6G_10265 [Deefgea sp.]
MAFENFYYTARKVYVLKRNIAGYGMGQVADPNNVDASSATVESSALVLNMPVTVTPPTVTRASFEDKGGQQLWQNLDGGVDGIASGTMVLSRESSALNSVIASLGTNTSQSTSFEQGGTDPTVLTLNPVWIGFERLVSDYDGASFTAGLPSIEWYQGTITPPTRPEMNQTTGINPQALTYTINASRFKRFLTGQLLSAMANATYQNGETLVHKMDVLLSGASGVIVHTAVMEAAATTFTLPYRPSSSGATVGGGNLIFKNGVQIAVTSVNTTTGVVTIASAGADNDIWEFIGPTTFVAL